MKSILDTDGAKLKVGDKVRIVDYAPTKERGSVKKITKTEVWVSIDGKPQEACHASCLQLWQPWMDR